VSEGKQEVYALDASMPIDGLGVYCFCPLNEDGSITLGLSFISDGPPDGAAFGAVFHSDGQEAVEAWCDSHQEVIERLCRDYPREATNATQSASSAPSSSESVLSIDSLGAEGGSPE
jgi:hypothetical protein